jgi:hypothetical protein
MSKPTDSRFGLWGHSNNSSRLLKDSDSCDIKLGCAFLKESSGIPPEFQGQAFEIAGAWFLLPKELKNSQTDRKGTFKNRFLFSRNLFY